MSLVTALSVEPLGHGAIRGNILLPSTRSARAAAAKLPETAQLRVFDVDMELANLAASLKAQYNLPYADCSAAALAQARKATLATSDEDFERVGTALRILWV